jgi:S-DNA-T family DNA segregation ATPase FtsK/SpoIIIE
VRLRALPTHSDLDRCAVPPAGLRLGFGGDTAAPVAIDPFAAGHLVVAGPPRSGRTTVLGTLLAECVRTGTSTVVAAPPRSPLHDQGRALGMPVVGPGAPPESVQVPAEPTVLLVDDCAAFDDVPAGEYLTAWLRSGRPIVAIVAGRTDDLASAYRGLGAEARRSRCGLLLQPGPIDGELFGVRLRRNSAPRIPGRGLLIGVPGSTRTDAERGCAGGWIALDTGEPVPIQVARSEVCGRGEGPQPPAMWGYR